MKLKTRMVAILGVLTLLQTGSIGLFALFFLNQSLDEQIGQRALHVAKTVAAMPQVIDAIKNDNSEFLQPVSIMLADTTQARFVVIGDSVGKRLAHPNPDKIGKLMSDDEGDDSATALVYGKGYVSKAKGSLGWSMRGKAPVFDEVGEQIIGVVSVGYLLDRVEEIIHEYETLILFVIVATFALSAFIAVWFANHFKQAIFGLEPEQIGRLYEERNATLESIREGVISVNADGVITTFNKAAVETLGLGENVPLLGRPIAEVLPDSGMLEVLASGKPQFDQEVWLKEFSLIVNRVPLKTGSKITGVVSSFRRKNELDLVSRKLTRIQQYADSLRSQSHEYSNKLHTIAGLIEIDAKDEALALIGHETKSHQALIHLLFNAVPDPVIAGCLLGKYNRARELGLSLYIDPESQMVDVPERLPREQLVSILGNLIDNALEATLSAAEQSGANYKGVVKLSLSDVGNDLIFEVEDEGPGIAPHEQTRVFQKGVSSKKEDGHGIGLHLVQKLLKGLGGTVLLESGEEGGCRFVVYIPKNWHEQSRLEES